MSDNVHRRGAGPQEPKEDEARLEWLGALRESLADRSFVKLAIGHYGGNEQGLRRILARKALIGNREQVSFTYRYKTRDEAKNADTEDGIRRVERAFEDGFRTGVLFTTGFDLTYERFADGRTALRRVAATQPAAAPLAHDRQKARLIPGADRPYLHALGITDAGGSVLKSAQSKYRQINRYVELLAPMISENMLKVVDMGSGKGYLTFALYDYLTTVRHMAPHVTGVEQRAELVTLCNRIAAETGFGGLRFVQGTIGDYDASGVDILIALHACDTATDDALAKGIAAGAALIVVAPCCHKQIRREMEKAGPRNRDDFLLKHGVFLERQAAMVTDGLRALVLESRGYTTKVFEFISDAHTAKNVMIVGKKRRGASSARAAAALEKLREAKARFGIGESHLEAVLA
jgi:ribosome modulation factor